MEFEVHMVLILQRDAAVKRIGQGGQNKTRRKLKDLRLKAETDMLDQCAF